MSGRRSTEAGFDRRWREAGAEADELAAIKSAIAEERDVATAPARSWTAVESRIRRREAPITPGAIGRYALALSMIAVVAVALVARLERRAQVVAVAVAPLERRAVPLPRGQLSLDPDGAIEQIDGEWVLGRGTAWVELERRAPGEPAVRFRAGDLSVTVVGTIFALHVEAGAGTVKVYEGAVIAERSGEAALRVARGSAIAPASRSWAPVFASVQDRWGEDAAARRMERDRAQAAAVSPSEPAMTPAASSPPPSTASAPAIAPKAPVVHPSRASVATPVATPAATDVAPTSPRVQAASETPPIAAPAPAAVAAPASPSRAGELAKYKAARQLLRSGHGAEAASAFSSYLREHPAGLLHEEAALSRLEALAAAHDPRLGAEAEAWLADHPKHPRSAEVRALVGR